jgi:hypothetical protein
MLSASCVNSPRASYGVERAPADADGLAIVVFEGLHSRLASSEYTRLPAVHRAISVSPRLEAILQPYECHSDRLRSELRFFHPTAPTGGDGH